VPVAKVRTPRSAWVEAALQALATGGPEGIRVEALAAHLGVSKGGFYWHFDDRAALLEEMLDSWERLVIDEAIARVEAGGGDPRARLRRLFALTESVGEVWNIELAIRDWARRDAHVAARLQRIDNRRMDYMRGLFGSFCADEDEVEVRCTLVMSLFVANKFIAADHAPRSRTEVLKMALERLVA
jgi:AcrR family transcriptional regulator